MKENVLKMKNSNKEKLKEINQCKATNSKIAAAETKRVKAAIIDYRTKNGINEARGEKVILFADYDKKKAERLAWLENQRLANVRTPKEIPVVESLDVMMASLDTENLSVEDLMLAKEKLRNDRIRELNKQIY